MPSGARAKDLYTASQVARFCQVDLKTIHNWADRGEIVHFRTPGRHLRFRRDDVLDFLRKYGYPIPGEMSDQQPRVVLLLSDNSLANGVLAILQISFEIAAFSEPMDALLEIGARVPDAVVVEQSSATPTASQIIHALKQNERTRNVRAVLFCPDGDLRATSDPASTHVQANTVDALRDTLEAMMGVER